MENDLIFDIGMHAGKDTEYYLQKGFRVVAVEANPSLIEAATKRFSGAINAGRLTLVPNAIAATKGEVKFFINQSNSAWSSIMQPWAVRGKGFEEIVVSSITPPDLFAKFGSPYYLKIDIEGADKLVVRALKQLPTKPRYVSFEGGNEQDIRFLHLLGYRYFNVVAQRQVPNVRLPNPAKEGQFIDFKFEIGSSGPFGLELMSPWTTMEDAIIQRANIQRQRKEINERFPNSPSKRQEAMKKIGWFDLHAALSIQSCD